MIHLIGRPFPDELLNSVWGRTCRRTGMPITLVTKALTGHKAMPSFFQCMHVGTLAEAMRMDVADVLDQHTVFRYATAFLSPSQVERARGLALSTGVAARSFGPTTQSVSDFVPMRRWCPECCREEVRRLGTSYWHVSHNLPGVLVCLTHRVSLRHGHLRTTGSGTWSYLFPHEVEVSERCIVRPNPFVYKVAESSLVLLTRVGDAAPWCQEDYRAQVFETGLAVVGRQLNEASVVRLVKQHAGAWLEALGFRSGDLRLLWPALMLRGCPGTPFVPLKHVVLKVVLESATGSTPGVLNHVPTGPSAADKSPKDALWACRLRRITKEAVKRGRSLKVRDALIRVGGWNSFRHRRAEFPQVAKAVLALRRSHARARDLPKRQRHGA
jgi:hypothetical protein